MDATSRYSPSCSTRISGVLRSFPLLLPRLVTMITGRPVSRSVLARWPPDASYSATWSRTHRAVLGSYSPSRLMKDTLRLGQQRLAVCPGQPQEGRAGHLHRLVPGEPVDLAGPQR